MNLTKAISVAFLLMFFCGWTQQSAVYTHPSKQYREALMLYNEKQYQASQTIFEEVKTKTTDPETEANCAYYVANAAIRLNQLGADAMMEDFVERYPTSTKRNSAFLDVGDYYFEQGKYPNALKWFDKAEDQSMSYADRENFNFKKGYALFVSKKYNDAQKYFNQVTTSPKYGSQAKYYIGYMAYQGDDFNTANQYFDQISGDEKLNEKLSYYQADMNFKLGNFEKAIALAKEQLTKADRAEVSELNKIIGESYFNLKQYEAAIPYLKEYKGKQGRLSNVDLYQLGYAYYKQGDFENAINQFNKIVDGNNAVAQNAYYHLGECYLKTGKKQQALNAFRNAAQMQFDAQIKKDASLNYARLSYDIGNPYESVPEVLANYLKEYPDSESKQEVQELLVDSYITSKNYEAALSLLEKNRNFSTKTTYQKVAFYRGLELFADAKYTEAVTYFDKSLKEPQDNGFTARAVFWKAEADYLSGNYNSAVIGFKQFEQNAASAQTPEHKNLPYNLGYAYFNQKEYAQAANYFEKYTSRETQDKQRLNDAWLRLGDSHFATAKYWPAMEAYNKAIALNGANADYAHYQKAISYGFVDRNQKKTEDLEAFINKYPKSVYRDDALYELGNTYVAMNQTSKGTQAYNRLASEYKKSNLVPKALLKEGLIYYNGGQNSQALAKFKTVVRDFPGTQEALQAVATAKLIYVDEGRVDEYATWVKGLDFVEVSDVELDNAAFESAEKQYAQKNTDAAIKSFENYLKQFPKGLHSFQANYYLAQAYSSKGQKDKALPYFKNLAQRETNEHTELALTRLSEHYLETNNISEAISILKRLEEEASESQSVTYAQSNLMKLFYQQKNYAQTVQYAEKVLAKPGLDVRIKSDAHTMVARSAIATGDENRAKTAYAEVQKIATGSLAAEALYFDAYFKNKEGNYEVSNTAVQKLAKDYAGYKEFGAKGLVVMAKNFYSLDDAFQATYILESVIKNFPEYPEVVAEAKSELALIKAAEAKRNSSVNPDQN